MSKINISTCACCNKVLAGCDTIWASGPLFCSEECGISWAKTLYDESEYSDEQDLTEKATAYFHDVAEEVEVEAIGVEKNIFTAYSPECDMTTIFRETFENEVLLYVDVVGFYFGRPDADATEKFTGDTRATMIRCEDI